ncbi:mono/diheme cytochrome c family protein [Virgibacillus natechei]|uniref:Mono/diheme cytochrome c family protein n=1 Tax=Virgibacillus natechei TaxID=1216297 RepID=A0ABS4IDH5_9BACI|nr:cytochrome c [Virgibacillus natechei]MBP1968690.1 mono/diheme cytochrome c family protein [Virgibacillus natechei]UZD11492.1 cytochrome c [Virgibacillus natechei]
MRGNPVIPYAIIAVLGILTVLVVSIIGVGQREDIAEDGNGEEQEEAQEETGDEAEEGATEEDPSEVYTNNCMNCHGEDLSGGSGPELAEVGDRLSEDEIEEIIIEGTDAGMPGGLVDDEQAAAIATWLAEQ